MNKAFLREPEQTDARCPSCQSVGQVVGPQTLNAQLTPVVRKTLAESGYFCSNVRCEVVYYDDFAGAVSRQTFPQAIPLKDADAPLCACFGVMRSDIEEDVAAGCVTRTRAAVLKSQSDEARCATQAPNGRTCAPELQRYYLRCKQHADRK